MKHEKKPLQLLRRTSEPDDSKQSGPVVFVDLETFAATGALDVIVAQSVVAQSVVVLPLVCELTYVPGPDGLQ